ncbi:MAG TPA: MipA/OmpV family protein [Albitalea sp.]|uniref:MipA/OmpV family protein n=1 Tax=Piscinibacter sp. TaxID=1903157 RepID=UPI002ED082D8
MRTCRRVTCCALAMLAAAPAVAADAPPDEPPKPVDWKWEGALGPVVSLAPQYSGSSSRRTSVSPGYYLRYGRISLSNASGFVTRRNKDDVFRGLGLDLKQDDRLRLNVALRIDNGRRSSDSSGLVGVEDVKRTVRARSSATFQVAPTSKVALGWSTDLLGRGGGNIVDLGASHDRGWSAFTTWSVGASISAADARNMRSYYGVTPAASAINGLPVYEPGAGLRDVTLGTGWRTEVDDKWIVLWGGSVSRLVGPAARSPLTTAPRQWGVSAAIARRF